MIEPPVTPANLEMIRDLISEAADSDLTVAACWLPELRCAWVGRIVAGVCVGWIMAPAETPEDGKLFAATWTQFWRLVEQSIDGDAEQAARDLIAAAKKNVH